MLTHRMNKIAIKTGFDVAHLAITVLLATTSWAALFGGLSEKFTAFGATIIMLLINIAFDGFPFILGCYVSGELGQEDEDDKYLASDNLWVVAVVAMVLHIGSGVITFSGAGLVANLFSNGEVITEQMGREERRIQAQNAAAISEYNQAVSTFEASKAKRLEQLAQNHNNAVSRLQQEREAMQKQGYPKNASLIAQKIAALEKGYQESVMKIQAESPGIRKPQIQSPGGYAKGLQRQFEEDLKAKGKIAFALKFTDICSLVIMALWFLVLFMVPGIAGVSNLVIWMFGWAFTLAAKVSQKALSYEKLLQANSDDQLYALAAIEENAIRRLQKVEKSYQEQLAQKEESLLTSFRNKASLMQAEFLEERKAWAQEMERRKAEWETEKARKEEIWKAEKKAREAEIAKEKSEKEREKALREAEKKARKEKKREEKREKARKKTRSGTPILIGVEKEREEKREKVRKGEKENEKRSENARSEVRKKVRKRELRENPVEFEGQVYKNLSSFEGSMRKMKSSNNRERFLRMKAFHNNLLGIETEIKRIS